MKRDGIAAVMKMMTDAGCVVASSGIYEVLQELTAVIGFELTAPSL